MLNRIKFILLSLWHPGHVALIKPDMPDRVPLPQPDWPAIYRQLDARHGIAQRGIGLYLFLRNPEQHEYWITFFFANPTLFKDRVGLHFFINHDPEHIVSVLQAHKRTPVVSELMCSSQVERIGDSAATLIQPKRCKQLRAIGFRGGRYIQPVNKHRINPRLKAHG